MCSPRRPPECPPPGGTRKADSLREYSGLRSGVRPPFACRTKEEREMDTKALLILWGSPVGIAIFFAGLGVLLWGVSRLKQSEVARDEFELRRKERNRE